MEIIPPYLRSNQQILIDLINTGKHPFVEGVELKGVQASHVLEEALNFTDYIILALPVQVIREVLKGEKS